MQRTGHRSLVECSRHFSVIGRGYITNTAIKKRHRAHLEGTGATVLYRKQAEITIYAYYSEDGRFRVTLGRCRILSLSDKRFAVDTAL